MTRLVKCTADKKISFLNSKPYNMISIYLTLDTGTTWLTWATIANLLNTDLNSFLNQIRKKFYNLADIFFWLLVFGKILTLSFKKWRFWMIYLCISSHLKIVVPPYQAGQLFKQTFKHYLRMLPHRCFNLAGKTFYKTI